MKGEISNNTVIVGDFNTPLTSMDRSTKQKIIKETQTLNDTMDQTSVSSVLFSHSALSDSLRPHESQHTRPPLSITNSRSSLRLTSIESVMPFCHLILCYPLLLLPPISPSIRVFSHESTLHMRWPKYWSFSFSIILSKEIPGLISFRMD